MKKKLLAIEEAKLFLASFLQVLEELETRTYSLTEYSDEKIKQILSEELETEGLVLNTDLLKRIYPHIINLINEDISGPDEYWFNIDELQWLLRFLSEETNSKEKLTLHIEVTK